MGNPFLLLPKTARRKEKIPKGQTKETNERYNLGRAWPVLFTFLPWDLISIPVLIHSGPGSLRRPLTPHPRALQELNHRPDSVVLPAISALAPSGAPTRSPFPLSATAP